MIKKALLILIGGRQTPNLLTVQHLKPDIIVPIASHEALNPNDAWDKIKPSLEQLCTTGIIEAPYEINAFELSEIKKACQTAFNKYPDADWFFNITCASTIMSIGAYEVGKEKNASIWYLDTINRKVVVLQNKQPIGSPYNISVENYLKLYVPKINLSNEPSSLLIEFAQVLSKNCSSAMHFRDSLKNATVTQKTQTTKNLLIQSRAEWVEKILHQAKQSQLILSYTKHPDSYFSCEVQDDRFLNFMDGKWLELYVWESARLAGCFDDYRWDVNLSLETTTSSSSNQSNQIDFAATYLGSLLIAECKTDKNPFEKPAKNGYLDKLSSIARRIGGNYVGTMFICSQSSTEDQKQAYQNFSEQAKERRIVVVTGDQLINLSTILKNEVLRPSYNRG
ncbi:MAG: hypothetical protein FD167_219 [bacterium]|nr:MAG: hypothetical protein FD167_219 [bacterium]